MRFDITKMPIDKMVMGMLTVVLAVTFVFAFLAVEGDEGGEGAVATSPSPTASPGGSPAPGGGLEIVAVPVSRWQQTELTVPAGQPVTVTMNNRDTGQLHNWAVYQNEAAARSGERALFATSICTGSCTASVTFTATAGEYFFRCDIHPQMTGKLIVR